MAQQFSPRAFPIPIRAEPDSSSGYRKLDLKVVFTSISMTKAAVTAAVSLARGLDARITILAAQVVPYPLPLANPQVPVAFTERNLLRLVEDEDTETAVEIHLCRDRDETIRRVVTRGSVVVIGAKKRWWRTREESLARVLRADGHKVVLVTV